jgi:hypothetical protein
MNSVRSIPGLELANAFGVFQTEPVPKFEKTFSETRIMI